MLRERTNYRHRPSGSSTLIFSGENFVFGIPAQYDYCSDNISTSHYGDNDFLVKHVSHTGGWYSGATPQWIHNQQYVDRYSGGVFPDISYPSSDLNNLASKVMAQTNPSSPSDDVPSFVAQLPEMLTLLRSEARNLLFGGSELYVKFRFGIAPFVSDLKKISSFVDDVSSRMNSLRNAQRFGRTTRKVSLGKLSWEVNQLVTLNTFGQVRLECRENIKYDLNRWGYCKWYPNGTFPKSPEAMLDLVRKAVYGTGFSTQDLGRTAWELIPWSWLIDWFSNIGDIMDSNRNILDMTPGEPGVCEHLTCTMGNEEIYNSREGAIFYEPFQYKAELKRRRHTVPVLAATIPFITGSQLSILGALSGIKGGALR